MVIESFANHKSVVPLLYGKYLKKKTYFTFFDSLYTKFRDKFSNYYLIFLIPNADKPN